VPTINLEDILPASVNVTINIGSKETRIVTTENVAND
jgi:hypothetical protein